MTKMKTVLLTGFDPVDGAAINPSWEAVRQLDGWSGQGFRVVARELPCVFGRAADALCAAVDEVRPDIAIAVGQAGGRPEISVERIAINVDDERFPDNAGLQPIYVPIVADGPAAYFTTLPIKAMVAAMREQGRRHDVEVGRHRRHQGAAVGAEHADCRHHGRIRMIHPDQHRNPDAARDDGKRGEPVPHHDGK